MKRIAAALVLLWAPCATWAQTLTPAQQYALDIRYRAKNTNIEPTSIVNTSLTEAVVFGGVVHGLFNALQYSPDSTRFNTASNYVERLTTNGDWVKAAALGGSLASFSAGGVTNGDIASLELVAGVTNLVIGHLVNSNTSLVTFNITGAIGPRGYDGVGSLNAGSWQNGANYDTNTLVTYGNVVYLSRNAMSPSTAPPPSDSANWAIWLVGGTNGVNGISGTNGIGYAPRGDWNSIVGYQSNDLVRSHGALYAALQGSTNVEPTAGAGWSNYWFGVVYDGADGAVIVSSTVYAYDSGASYSSNQFVTFFGQTWASLNPILPGDPPGSTNWVLAAARGSDGTAGGAGANGIGNMFWLGSWDSGTTYPSNCLVSYGGRAYASLVANTSVDPALNPGTWSLAVYATDGANGLFGGSWTNDVTYTNAEVVSQHNSLYYSLTAGNVGNAPTNSPGYWGLVLSAAASVIDSISVTGPVTGPVTFGGNITQTGNVFYIPMPVPGVTLSVTNPVTGDIVFGGNITQTGNVFYIPLPEPGVTLSVTGAVSGAITFSGNISQTGTVFYIPPESDPVWVGASNMYVTLAYANSNYATGDVITVASLATNLPDDVIYSNSAFSATNLFGKLPALDGSALTNLTPSAFEIDVAGGLMPRVESSWNDILWMIDPADTNNLEPR